MSAQVEISVGAPVWEAAAGAEGVIRRAIETSEARLGAADDDVEVSVRLADDAEIRELNRQWRGKDSATNVLSFPTPEGPGGDRHLGDIVIAYETVRREAEAEGKAFDAHLAHLAVHGYLHLSGYDHEDDDEAEEMEDLERSILADLGVADPYEDKGP